MPSIPRNRFKIGAEHAASDKWKIGADAVSRVQVYALAENLLNRHYATFGTLFDTQAVGFLPLTDPRTVSPATRA